MSRITELLRRVAQQNPGLAEDLREEVQALSERRAFGLNFERHIPETVQLPHRTVRRGDKVRFLAPRGEEGKGLDDRLWLVARVTGKGKYREAHLVEWGGGDTPEQTTRKVEDLIVVAEFRDAMYPGLRSTGTINRGGDKPYHLVINGENYHSLDALLFTYEAKIDCIYIDPPYNTRDKDWKYNNDYVDSDDAYKHSKWLAMMERRLKLAKRLLKPEESVLIVTIDEKEYLRLGLLLEQVFPDAGIQMISTVISPQGAARKGAFARTDEYIYFVCIGEAAPRPVELDQDWLGNVKSSVKGRLHWSGLRRTGTNARREDRENLFYPVFLTEDAARIHSIGESISLDTERGSVSLPESTIAVWPIRSDGSEGNWQLSPDALRAALQEGFVRVGRPAGEKTTISYLKAGEQKKVRDGKFPIIDRRPDGSVVVDDSEYRPSFVPGTQWNISSHDASRHGSGLLRKLIPGRSFPFPKSLYAVEDALRFFVETKPRAIILDFFAGSGTTAHAVMRLNHWDSGQRQAILVTNNEVSAEEEADLRKRGFRAGDAEWEALGICEHVTKPRIQAAITGETPEGQPVSGEYRFTDEFPMKEGLEENVEFFELTYQDPEQVRLGMGFAAVAPLLWIRAGSEGRRIDIRSDTCDVTDIYGVLFNIDAAREFLDEAQKRPDLRVAYVITDEEKQYQAIADQLPAEMEVVQLYEAYLTTFELNSARDSR